MEIFLEYVDKVGLIGIIVAITAFLTGIKFPDWDFKLKLQHRSILTHSPLFLFLLIELYKKEKNDTFRFFIAGFALALAVHFIFDFFPKGWSRGALLHIPIARIALSPKISKILFMLSIIISVYITVNMTKSFEEFLFLGILALWTFLKHTIKEEKFFRPCILFTLIFLFIGSFKFDEINKNLNKSRKYIISYVKEIKK
ncbi:hypothetical protein I6E17_04495 [Fusobacterium perfoetens]|uniref:hypothetical protein n=1 Tax=Fusobacterium perfoetens TaxID=852 RepID=UPI0015A2EF72|nr:hypothetical protein [Fusobacterium perfoetens]MCF2625439.1 hypothetical protein [Fusobacterium perfoetens]